MVIARREPLAGALLAAPALPGARAAAGDKGEELRRGFADLERRHGGRLGVAVLDTGGGAAPIAHRGDERFPMTSTFKFVAAAFVLARADRGEESLARRIAYGRDRLVAYSPVAEKHAGGDGPTVGELCDAAVTLSDNTAGNLLLGSFGGPAGLTAYMRSLGDGASRLDRRETALNEAAPGDPRDTTTPAAMLGVLREAVLGSALSAPSRARLAAWLVNSKTGDKRRRAAGLAGRVQNGLRREQRHERHRRFLAVRRPRADPRHRLLRRGARVRRRAERGPGGSRAARGVGGLKRPVR